MPLLIVYTFSQPSAGFFGRIQKRMAAGSGENEKRRRERKAGRECIKERERRGGQTKADGREANYDETKRKWQLINELLNHHDKSRDKYICRTYACFKGQLSGIREELYRIPSFLLRMVRYSTVPRMNHLLTNPLISWRSLFF